MKRIIIKKKIKNKVFKLKELRVPTIIRLSVSIYEVLNRHDVRNLAKNLEKIWASSLN
jgi:phosphoserine aminotransferase